MTPRFRFAASMLALAAACAAGVGLSHLPARAQSSGGAKPESPTVVKRQGEPDVFRVHNQDAAMNQAIRKARQSVGGFIFALRHPQAEQKFFTVKKPFPIGSGHEHIWLSDVRYDGRLFHGKVANDAVDVKNVKFGDEVTVAPQKISDWMYIERGKLKGGYTLRVLYDRASPQEKAQMRREFGFGL